MSYIEAILKRAKSKADSAEVFHLKTEEAACAWNGNKLKIAEAKETMGVAIRVIIGGKTGFFASNKLDDPDKIVDTACELAPFGFEFAGEFPKSYKPAKVDIYNAPTAEVGVIELADCGNRAIAKINQAKPEAIFESKLEREVVQVVIANTHGARTEYRKSVFSGFLYGSVTKEGDVLSLYEFDNSSVFENQPDAWADVIIEKFRDASNIVDLPTGEYTCVVTPKAAGFFGPLNMAMNARSVLKDMSPFKGKIGEQVFDERISLVDDGHLSKMPSSQPVDDEGVTTGRTGLIDKGVLKGYIHDLHTAKKMGVAPTGNGMRYGLSSAPRVGYTTLMLSPGKRTLKQMISGIKKGIIVDQIMGAHQASPFSGDFSVSVDLGFVVEDGKIIGRFKNGMLSGSVFRMLKDQLVEIGSEAQLTGLLIPPVVYEKMSVSTGS